MTGRRFGWHYWQRGGEASQSHSQGKEVADKIEILEEKMNYVGTYALDSVSLIDVV